METTKGLLAELYTAYFNRAPDAAGLAYWEEQLNSGSMNFDAIAQNWANEQPEFVQTYGENPDSDTLINKVYENVLGRAPDDAGAAYWSDELANGNIGTSALIEAVVAGAKAPTGSPQDAQLLQNKATVGVQAADAGIDDLTFAKKVVQAVSADINTVGVVVGLINVAKADTTALAKATQTLDSVHTMLTTLPTDTLKTTIANLKSIVVSMVADVSAGNVADVAATLQATTATVEAATQDPTYIADPLTVASNITSDPETAQTDANAVIEPSPTPSPAPSPAPAPAPDTTPPAMSSAVVNADGDIVITYTESITGSTAEVADYAVTVDGSTLTPTSATLSGSTVTLTMPTKVLASSTVSDVTYTAANGTANSIKDAANNAAADQTLATVTNNSVCYTVAGAGVANTAGTLPTTYKIVDTAANAATDATTNGGSSTYVTGNVDVTLTDAATVAQLNAIDAATTGVITATIADNDMTTLAGITDANSNNALTISVKDASVDAAALNTLDTKTSVAIDASTVGTLTGAASDVKTAVTSTGIGLSGLEAVVIASDTVANNLLAGTNTSDDINAIAAATTGTLKITLSDAISSSNLDAVRFNGQAQLVLADDNNAITTVDATVASGKGLKIEASALTGTNTLTFNGSAENDGIFIIDGGAGADSITGGAGADSITGGAGNDVIRGGAGADTITGGAGDDTFVVLGAIAANDYTVADVTAGTGANKLGLANLIDTGLATGDSGTDGTGETYDGGAGTNTLEIWGAADLSGATISNIDTIDTHSDLTISAGQLQSLFASNPNGVDLNLFSNASAINITGVTQGTGLELLNTFNTAIDSNLINSWTTSGLPTTMPTVTFDLYALDPTIATTYTIKPEDMLDLSGITTDTLTDASGENSVMYTDTTSSLIRTIIAGDGKDIIVVDGMSSAVTVNGGAGDDILAYQSTASSDLDNVTNVEVVSLIGASANITTVNSLVVNTVQTNGLAVSAGDLTGSLTFDGSAETDGYFRITGSNQADSITGGAGADFIIGGAGDDTIIGGAGDDALTGGAGNDTFTITAGTDTVTDLSGSDVFTVASGATMTANVTANFTATSATQNLGGTAANAVLAAAAGINIDMSAATVTTAASDGFTLNGNTGDEVIKGSSGNDTITGGAGADTITGGAGADIINFIAESASTIYDTVTDGTTGDTIHFAGTDNGTSTFTITAVAWNSDLATTLNDAVSGDGSGTSTYKWFTDNTDSYIAIDNSASATFVDGTDALIKLAGVTNLSGATFNEGNQTLTLA